MLVRLVCSLAFLACALLPCRALAHAVLVEARPADGAQVDLSPAEITLRFNEPVRPIAVRLLDDRGAEMAGLGLESRDETIVVRVPAPLRRGTYFLVYRVASIDAHPVGATLRFGVGTGPVADLGMAPSDQPVRWAGVVTRWLVYLSLLGSMGTALFVILVRPPPPLDLRCRRLVVGLAWMGCPAVATRFGVAGLDMAGLPLPDLASFRPWETAAATTLATASCLALTGSVVLALASRRSAWWVLAGSLAITGSFALTGHAAAAEPHWLTRPALGLHVLCAGFWLGSLVPLLWSLRLHRDQAFLVLHRFSNVAVATVGILVVAGAALGWVQLGGRLRSLWDTDYGERLTIKLVLVAMLLLIGLANRVLLTPSVRQGRPGAARREAAALKVDLLLGVLVLAVTASFPLAAPPRAIQQAASAEARERQAITITSRGRTAVIALVPEAGGSYRLEARVTEADGTASTGREAAYRWSLPGAGIEPARTSARETSPGLYVATGLVLPLPGRWAVRLDLLIDDFTRLIFEGGLPVGQASGPGDPDAPGHDHHHPP